MRLVPVTGPLGVVSKVAARCGDDGRMFTQLVLFESLSDAIDPERDTLEAVMLANMEDIAKRARAALEGVADDEVSKALDTMDEFAKAGLMGWLREKFNREHPRGRDGRFISADVASGDPNMKGVGSRQSSAHIAAVEQATKWRNAGLINDDTPLQLVYTRYDENGKPGTPLDDPGKNPRTTLKQMASGQLAEHAAENPDMVLAGIKLDRGHIPANTGSQRAALDVMTSIVGRDDATARRLLRGLPWDEQGKTKDMSQAARDFHAPSGQAGRGPTDRKAYRQMSAIGTTLSRISAPGSTVNTVGGVAQLVGDLGPEAEKVLGPGIRRTAYRYRGTERRPDANLVAEVENADALSDAQESQRTGVPMQKPAIVRDALVGTMAGRISSAQPMKNVPSDQRTMAQRGNIAIAYLLGELTPGAKSHLPSKELTELSLESGEVPPSEGVLIDADGNVVSQAVGYNGDHYLPFDLKNLHRLFGGQYVRTRAAGGPSTEDLYTALVTGTRQIQVVSNSGVFTVEFDPDLRGARRFNDKVKRMVSRYGEMLETIAGGTLYQQDLDPQTMNELRRQASEASHDQDSFDTNLNILRGRARLQGGLADSDENDLAEEAEAWARTEASKDRRDSQISPANYRQHVAELRDQYIREHGPTVRKLKLDGPGYERALQALRQEFPYYIRRASFMTLPDWLSSHGLTSDKGYRRHYASDRGRVEHGQTNARLPGGKSEQVKAKAARRLVPTTAAAPVPLGEAAASAPVAERGTPAAATPAAAGARPAGDPLTEMKKPGSPYMAEVQNAIRHTIRAFNVPDLTPEQGLEQGDYGEEHAERFAPVEYAYWKWEQFSTKVGPDQAAVAMANWLVNDASEHQRRKILDAIPAIARQAGNFEGSAYTPDSLTKGGDRLKFLLGLTKPFGEEATDQALLAELPEDGEPKPLAFADIKIGGEDRVKALKISEPQTADMIEEFDGLTAQEMAREINYQRIATIERTEGTPEYAKQLETLAAMHRAFAYHTAKQATEALGKMGVVAGPKAPPQDRPDVKKSDLRPRRVLVFHVPSNASVVKSHGPNRPRLRLSRSSQ